MKRTCNILGGSLLILLVVVCVVGGAFAFKEIKPLATASDRNYYRGKRYPEKQQPGVLFKKQQQHHPSRSTVSLLQSLTGGSAAPPASPDSSDDGVPKEITFQSDRRGVVSWIFNFMWLATIGWTMSLTWFLVGVGLCCTIVGFPVGYQAIKLSFFLLFPFGKSLRYKTKSTTGSVTNFVLNLIWAITVGWFLALQAIVNGIVLCASLIGIPFGIQCFKFARLCFRPFGIDYSAIEETTYVVMEKKKPPPGP